MNISRDIGREPQIHRCHWGMTVQWAFVSYRKGSWANASSSMLHSPKRLLKLLKWCKNVYFCCAQPWSHARCYFTHSLKCTKFGFDLTFPPAGFNCFIKQKSAWLRLWSLVSMYDKTGKKCLFCLKKQQDGKPRWQSWRLKVLLTLLDPRLSCLLKLRNVIKKLHG